MKMTHIIPPSKRMIKTYINMINHYFDKEEHVFFILNPLPPSEADLLTLGNVKANDGVGFFECIRNLKNVIKESDYVIWHGFSYGIRYLLWLFLSPKSRKKSLWYMWGIDLYNWKLEGKSIRSAITNYLGYSVRKNMGAVISLFPTDETIYRELFQSKAKCYNIPYAISDDSFRLMEEYRNWLPRENGHINVQIAHNAHEFNNHHAIIDKVAALLHNNYFDMKDSLDVFIPLSYGCENGRTYANRVATHAQTHFGERARPISTLIPQNAYTRFLWNMDVSVYASKRQNALGNILKSLYMGNYVFLSSESPLYPYMKDHNITVFDIEDLPNYSKADFQTPLDNENAVRFIREMFDVRRVALKWKALFGDLREMLNETAAHGEMPLDALMGLADGATRPRTDAAARRKENDHRFIFSPTPDAEGRLYVARAEPLGSEVLSCAFEQNKVNPRWSKMGLIDHEYHPKYYDKGGIADVIATFADYKQRPGDVFVCAALEPAVKKAYLEKLQAIGARYAVVRHPSAAVGSGTLIGRGCILLGNATLSNECVIHDFATIFECKIGSNVEIGKYATVGQGSAIGNYTKIGEGCRIGENAVIGNGVVIGENAFIGDGMAVGDDCVIRAGERVENIARDPQRVAPLEAADLNGRPCIPDEGAADLQKRRHARELEVAEINAEAERKLRSAHNRDAYFYRRLNPAAHKPLTEAERKEIDDFWAPYAFAYKNDPRTQWALSRISGKFDPSYIGFGLQRHSMARFWNHPFYGFVSDKSLLSVFFPEAKRAVNYVTVKKTGGGAAYFNEHLDPIARDDAVAICFEALQQEGGRVLFKETTGMCGNGIVFLEHGQTKAEIAQTFEKYAANSEGGFLCQQVIVNHPAYAAPHPESLNTLRITTMYHEGAFHWVGTAFRMGVDKPVDNWSAGGIACGVNEQGVCADFACTETGEIFHRHPGGFAFAGCKLHHYERAHALALRLHRRVAQQRYIAWDIAIDRAGDPVLIECNSPGSSELMQTCGFNAYLNKETAKEIFDDYFIRRFFFARANMDWNYREFSDHISLVKYCGFESVVEVPERIGGKKVTLLYKGAISGSQVEEVIIPSSVRQEQGAIAKRADACRITVK